MPSPKEVEERIEKMSNAWPTLAPGKSFGGMTFAQFEAAGAPSLEARRSIEELESQSAQKLAEREAADPAFANRARLAVAGDACPAPALHVKRACPGERLQPTDEGMDWTNQLFYGDNPRVPREVGSFAEAFSFSCPIM